MSNPFSNTAQVNAVIRIRRGPEIERSLVIPDQGELIYSTDRKRLFVGDGTEYGGYVVGNKAWTTDSFLTLTNVQKNDLVFLSTTSRFYMLTGNNQTNISDYAFVSNVNTTPPYVLPSGTKSVLGGVKAGTALSADNTGKLDVQYDTGTLKVINDKLSVPLATSSTVGVASFGTGLNVSSGNVSLVNATKTVLGGVKAGTALSMTNGVIDVKYDPNRLQVFSDTLTVPIATASTLGVARFGTGLNVDASGTVTAVGGGGGGGGGGGSGSGPNLSLSKNYIIGNGGASYALSNYADNDPDNYLVFINGVEQIPYAAYSVTVPNITFASTIPSGANIIVYATVKCGVYIPKPASPAVRNILSYDGTNWIASALTTINNGNFIPTPSTSLTGQVLTFNGSTWVSQGLPNFILNPGATTGQVLTFDGANWVGNNGVSSSDFTGSNQSLTTNGYQKLPGGLIMQWGVASGASSVPASVTFPITFPNSCFSVVIANNVGASNVAPTQDAIGTYNISSTGFSFRTNAGNTGGYSGNPGGPLWMAIGF